jgi:predicted amidohydrolase
MSALMDDAKRQGADLIVYPELALTTFFPRWYMEDQAEVDTWFEREMFERAARYQMAMYLGYVELTSDGHHLKRLFHNRLSVQAGAYQNSCWVIAVAKAGVEDGFPLIGGSLIVDPNGEIVAEARTEGDELLVHRCDLDDTAFGKNALDALLVSDYAPVQGFVLLIASIFVVINFAVDILYGIADPRATVA